MAALDIAGEPRCDCDNCLVPYWQIPNTGWPRTVPHVEPYRPVGMEVAIYDRGFETALAAKDAKLDAIRAIVALYGISEADKLKCIEALLA